MLHSFYYTDYIHICILDGQVLQNHPLLRVCPQGKSGNQADLELALDPPVLSEFDKHHEALLSADTEEGCALELHHYLGTMQQDVSKNTDLIEWWQVGN